MCDECHMEEYRDDCNRCANIVDKTELESRVGELIALLDRAPGLTSYLEPGYYRVTEWPFFANGMITACFYESSLQRVGDLEQSTADLVKYFPCAISLCAECRQSVSLNLPADIEERINTAPRKLA